MLLSEREERASGTNTQDIVQSSTSNTLVEKEDDKAPIEEDNDDKKALALEDTDKDREGEDIDKALALADNDKNEEDSQANLLTADENDTSSTRLLTDEHVADSHTKCLDEIATLINGIGILPSSSSSSTCVSMNTKAKDILKEQKDTMGDEILKLVSKILSQRVVGVSPAPPQSTIDPPQVYDDIDKVDPPPSEGDCEVVETSSPRRSSSDCSVASAISPEEDRSTSTVSTPYIVSKTINEMSSNSLFDSSPSMYYQESSKSKGCCQRKFDFEDSESTLEIVYEYYSDWSSDESRGSSSSSTYQRSRYTSASEHVDTPPRGYHRYSPSPSRSRHRSCSRSASKSRCSSSSRYGGSRSKRSSSSSTPKKFKSSSYSNRKRSTPKSRSTPSRKGSLGKRCASKPGSSSNESSRNKDRRSHSPPVEKSNIKASEAKDQKHDTVKADEEQDTLPQTQSHATGSASVDERPSKKEDNVVEVAKREEQLSSAIDKHLKSIQDIMTKQPQVKSEERQHDLSCALSATSDNTNTSRPSLGSQSTREKKGISISVVSRRSSQEDCLTFFIPTLTKKQVDGVLEELLETRETVSTQVANGANKASKKKKQKKYQGEYNEEGQRHGYGIYTSKNGNQYRGEWQHDQREGLGVVKIGQGDVFEGQFKGNLKNGVGVYHYDDGECDLSRYEDDVRVGDTIRYSEDRRQAFLLSSEKESRRISLEEAALIAKEMGTIVASKASSTS